MRNIRARKAFTLIELIIVIVILGILAGIAIVGYNAVINRANESKVEQAAQSYDRSIRALAAFDQGSPRDADYSVDMRGDLLTIADDITVTYFDFTATPVEIDDADIDLLDDDGATVTGQDVQLVVFTQGTGADAIEVTLTLSDASETPGGVDVTS